MELLARATISVVCTHTHARINYVVYTCRILAYIYIIDMVIILNQYCVEIGIIIIMVLHQYCVEISISSEFVFHLVEYCAIITHTFSIADVIWIYSKSPSWNINSIVRVCVKTLAYFVANTNVCLIWESNSFQIGLDWIDLIYCTLLFVMMKLSWSN